MEATTGTRGASSWSEATTLQRGVLVLSIINTTWAVAGLIANPDFATGEAATSVQVLGIDFNGWHALSGILAFAPGILIARSDALSRLYVLALIPLGFVIPGLWALVDTQPMGLWPFEHNEADAVLHLSNGVVYSALLLYTERERRRAAE
jgi:Domain of unknown function (DUF4383)